MRRSATGGSLILISASLYRRDDPYRYEELLNRCLLTPSAKLFALITMKHNTA